MATYSFSTQAPSKPDRIHLKMNSGKLGATSTALTPIETVLERENFNHYDVDLDILNEWAKYDANSHPSNDAENKRRFNGHDWFAGMQLTGQLALCFFGGYQILAKGDMTGFGWLIAGGLGAARQQAFLKRKKLPFLKNLDDRANVVLFGIAAAISIYPQLVSEIANNNKAGILAASAGITAYTLRSAPEFFLMVGKTAGKAMDWGKDAYYGDRMLSHGISNLFGHVHDLDRWIDKKTEQFESFLYTNKDVTFLTTQLPPAILFYRACQQLLSGLPAFQQGIEKGTIEGVAEGVLAVLPGIAFLLGSGCYFLGERQLKQDYIAQQESSGQKFAPKWFLRKLLPIPPATKEDPKNIEELHRKETQRCLQEIVEKIGKIKAESGNLKDPKIVIFTGSGISVASNTQTSDEMEKEAKVYKQPVPKHDDVYPKKRWLERGKSYEERLQGNRENFRATFNRSISYAKENKTAPNNAHNAIHDLKEFLDDNLTVITHNYDGLHEKTGVNPLTIRGTLSEYFCDSCEHVGENHDIIKDDEKCDNCGVGGHVLPNITLFGGKIRHYDEIQDAIKNADIFISIGSSDKYTPQSEFVKTANKAGALTVQINVQDGHFTMHYDHFLKGDSEELVPELVKRIIERLESQTPMKIHANLNNSSYHKGFSLN